MTHTSKFRNKMEIAKKKENKMQELQDIREQSIYQCACLLTKHCCLYYYSLHVKGNKDIFKGDVPENKIKV